jgi:FimV-like protein
VKAVGNLTAIVNKNYIDADVSKNQIMVAILAANPQAFKGGNINYMIRNADLSLPSVESIKSIPSQSATNLLNQHYRLFKQGRTGDLPPPAFISLAQSSQVETLVKEKAQQSVKLTSLEAEREQLREMVKRLESEKANRDTDLRALEERIQGLQSSSNSLGSATADLNLQLANGELTGDGAVLLEELEERNRSLNAQLQSARSEMAESTRLEISLERRMTDVQEENSLLSRALKEKGGSPAEVTRQSENNTSKATTATQAITAPKIDAASPAAMNNSGQQSLFDQYIVLIPENLRWLIWLLPLFLILCLLWFIWKLLSGGKNKTTRRVQQPATTAAFVDYTKPIDPELELEQEPQLEVSIKMDVARAYIEAGDFPAAREMLGEVISEGNAMQQQEAGQLLAEL